MTAFLRHFTLAEANALLPLASQHCSHLRDLLQKERALRLALRHAGISHGALDGDGALEEPLSAELDALNDGVEAAMAALHGLGAQVKSLEPFLVDFPALLHGRTVLLCWKEGEDSITHHHAPDTGFGSRVPIQDAAAFGTALAH
jgi:hypothetical protein